MGTNDILREAILKQLERKGISQNQFAETLGLPRQNVGAYLKGTKAKSSSILDKMLDELGLEVVVKVKK